MSATRFLVAFALLAAPPDVPTTSISGDLLVLTSPTLQQLALQLEILDPHELGYYFVSGEGSRADILRLRERFRDLADAPYVEDVERFPGRSLTHELLSFNDAFKRNLLDLRAHRQLENCESREIGEALDEAEQLYKVWDTLYHARLAYESVPLRRQHLKRLREALGPEAYWSGVMPPYVPVWRFRPVE